VVHPAQQGAPPVPALSQLAVISTGSSTMRGRRGRIVCRDGESASAGAASAPGLCLGEWLRAGTERRRLSGNATLALVVAASSEIWNAMLTVSCCYTSMTLQRTSRCMLSASAATMVADLSCVMYVPLSCIRMRCRRLVRAPKPVRATGSCHHAEASRVKSRTSSWGLRWSRELRARKTASSSF
jgi:hypothetical protein